MIDSRTAPYGLFGLRLALGILFLAHASLKIFVFTPAGFAHFFGMLGLPAWFAYLTILWEALGGAALILGVWPRLAALAVAPILLGAIAFVHGSAGFFFTDPNGGWEFPALWTVGLVVLALCGDGAFALVPTPLAQFGRDFARRAA
ncbi:MAG TPA: DoxX family protein [Roseiarcus sp.]|nr:DoxX family protein [Roseiarcus sp.]